MKCPKCKGKNITTWHAGGRAKAQCRDCMWHGLADYLYKSYVTDKKTSSAINCR